MKALHLRRNQYIYYVQALFDKSLSISILSLLILDIILPSPSLHCLQAEGGNKPPVNTIAAPLVMHKASCEPDEEIIKIQQCTHKTMTECQDVEVPSQKMEYDVKCQNVTISYCTNDLTTHSADEGENVKNAPTTSAPLIPLLEDTCVGALQEHCYQDPEVMDIKTSLRRCCIRICLSYTNIFTQIFR